MLSAVAEIERENIIEQTMNGRKEKARQGGWNGGFAPYGYFLKDKQLFIKHTLAAAWGARFAPRHGSAERIRVEGSGPGWKQTPMSKETYHGIR